MFIGPVKKASRIQVKAETDYVNDMFPSAAKVVDILRCSLTFESVESLVETVKYFQNLVETGDISLIKKEAENNSNNSSNNTSTPTQTNSQSLSPTTTTTTTVTSPKLREMSPDINVMDDMGIAETETGDEYNNNDDLQFTKIVRIKNGFLDIHLDNPTYADIKINVVFTNNQNCKSMIAEV